MDVITAKYVFSDGKLYVILSGEIDHHSAKAAREEIDARITELRPRALILDLKGIGFMDSSGLGLILGRFNKMKEHGGSLCVQNPSAGAARVLKLAGAEKIIPIEWTEETENEK